MRANIFAHRFIQSNQGVAMIEFAFILPVLVLITFGATEYGMYFLKSNMNNNNLAAAARAVQANPGDASNRVLLTQTSLINDEDNKSCAKSFVTFESAKAAECPPGLWDALPPKDLPEGQTAYFVLIESNVVSKSLSGLFDEGSALDVMMPTNVARQVIKVDSAATCTAEALDDRRCWAAIESMNAVMSTIDRISENHEKERTETYSSFTVSVSSNRKLTSEPAQCVSGKWSCENFKSHMIDSYGEVSKADIKRAPGQQTCLASTISNGSSFLCRTSETPKYRSAQAQGVKDVLLVKSSDLPSDMKACNDSYSSPAPKNPLHPRPDATEFSKNGKLIGSGKGYDCWSGAR